MTVILAIDSSTEACSVALLRQTKSKTETETKTEIVSDSQIAVRQHNNVILPMVEKVLAEAGNTLGQVDLIAFGRGPGSFVGVRVGCGVAQGLAFGIDCPVVAVSTLRAMAQGAHRKLGATAVMAVIDARMKEIYWGVFGLDQQNHMQPLVDEIVCPPEAAVFPASCQSVTSDWAAVGTGWSYQERILEGIALPESRITGVEEQWFPDAQDIAVLALPEYEAGKAVSAEQAQPVYLRDKVVQTPAKKTPVG
ncbi:MAG: tRNA (adenosine(37)-N6)-threonylcarbamoyltransferase complex dimerization subunit type 1 TsaB [Pseudomonadales bacterium]|nr:tRNA (adenosine(37)-N6)-threonylcarbamoyltransferase complex dimerization subunit type 1 TsaB [Pseudomonadales bacterium]